MKAIPEMSVVEVTVGRERSRSVENRLVRMQGIERIDVVNWQAAEVRPELHRWCHGAVLPPCVVEVQIDLHQGHTPGGIDAGPQSISIGMCVAGWRGRKQTLHSCCSDGDDRLCGGDDFGRASLDKGTFEFWPGGAWVSSKCSCPSFRVILSTLVLSRIVKRSAWRASSATAVAWRFTASADGVINHSYPALLTYGIVWLCAALLVRPILTATPQLPVIGPVLYWMTRRAMSIYLWHSPAIVGAYWLLARAGFNPSPLPVLGLTAMLVVFASTATGWIEDVAGGRSPELVPLPDLVQLPRLRISRPTTSVDSGLALPPAPSGRPDPSAASVTHQVCSPTSPTWPDGGICCTDRDR